MDSLKLWEKNNNFIFGPFFQLQKNFPFAFIVFNPKQWNYININVKSERKCKNLNIANQLENQKYLFKSAKPLYEIGYQQTAISVGIS